MFKEIELNGRTIKYRKWKVKDKKALDNAETNLERRKVFVYNCLENPDTPLDIEEYNFVLSLIRDFSLHNTLDYDLECPDCNHNFSVSKTSAQVVQPIFANYGTIEFKGNVLTVGNVRNRGLYEESINKTLTSMERYITDFALHIQSINGSDVSSVDEVVNFLYDLDVDDCEKAFEQWELMRFKCNVIQPVECPNCKKVNNFDFSDMPTFFPSSWEIK